MTLFSPLQLGRFRIPNRVTLAALTRSRAGTSGTPTELHAEYYAQRASAGLVVTEGTFPAVTTRAFPGQAGIETAEHAAGWAKVAESVHKQGGVLFMQIMHGGRLSHPGLLDGHQPEAPSAIASGTAVRDFEARKDCPVPRTLDTEELPRIVEQFRAAARRATDAGVDGVEIHGANGYLLHQFLAPSANERTDAYGGSPENRARLLVEVLQAVAAEIGADRVGLRLSPEHNIQGVLEDDPADTLATYSHVLDAVADLGLAYVSFLHQDIDGELIRQLAVQARSNGNTKVIANTGFGTVTDLEQANALMALDHVDAVAVGRLLLANPDLVRRWQENLELNAPDSSTFYTPGAKGYTDYPFAPAVDSAQSANSAPAAN